MVKKKDKRDCSSGASGNGNFSNESKGGRWAIKLRRMKPSTVLSASKSLMHKNPSLQKKINLKENDIMLQKNKLVQAKTINIKASSIKPCIVKLRKIKVLKQNNNQEESSSDGKMNHKKKIVHKEILSDPKLKEQKEISSKKYETNNGKKQLQARQNANLIQEVINEKSSLNNCNSPETRDESDIYDFPSQSSISEKEDPAKDVVKKLIKEGKASVSKHRRLATKKKNNKRAGRPPRVISKNLKERKEKKINDVDLGLSEFEFHQEKTSPIISREVNNKRQNQVQDSVKLVTDTPKGIRNRQDLLRRVIVPNKIGIARNFVNQSTPVNKKNISKPENELSPIYISSPWRPPDERSLPRVFYFSRNEDDLPSYSSDVIPSTQTIKETMKKVNQTGKETNLLNLSNIENIAPPHAVKQTDNQKIISDARKTLEHRSPLKTINILEIINLPNHKMIAQKFTKPQTQELRCNRIPILGQRNHHDNNNKVENSADNFDASNISIENNFGFDDIAEDENLATNKIIPSTNQLRKKLKSLKRLLPPKPTRISYGKIKTIFAEEPKQKDIREMLSSTRIENKGKQRQMTDLEYTFGDTINLSLNQEEKTTADLHLFDDPDEPKPKFDASVHTRTYTRIPRRRRKLRQDFILFSDDDESEEEVEEQKKVQKKKRMKRSDKKADLELSHFVEQFNSMCEEVERYQLQVE